MRTLIFSAKTANPLSLCDISIYKGIPQGEALITLFLTPTIDKEPLFYNIITTICFHLKSVLFYHFMGSAQTRNPLKRVDLNFKFTLTYQFLNNYTLSICPGYRTFGFPRLFLSIMSSTVILYIFEIYQRDSPGLTICVRGD